MNPLILIPARMASLRLPNKPMALIAGKPMIVQVAARVAQANMGEVYVACDGQTIYDAVTQAGYHAVITDPDLPSGSDRIYAALLQIDPQKKFDVVVNVQGDMPTLDPAIIQKAVALLENPEIDIGTLAAVITDEAEKTDPAVVKAIIDKEGQAINFTRQSKPSQDGRFLHHIGIYAYKRHALEKFVSLPPSSLELSEKLEQLRALNAGMRMSVAVVDTVPLGVDTPQTLEKARHYYE
jgi:3-deoxy-manno-octulosonate cytidylyltransferase (CMP-KDO synthetase)